MELNLKMLQAEQAEAGILKDLIQKLQTDLQAYPESLAAAGSNLAGNGSTLQADKEIGETSNCPVVDKEQA